VPVAQGRALTCADRRRITECSRSSSSRPRAVDPTRAVAVPGSPGTARIQPSGSGGLSPPRTLTETPETVPIRAVVSRAWQRLAPPTRVWRGGRGFRHAAAHAGPREDPTRAACRQDSGSTVRALRSPGRPACHSLWLTVGPIVSRDRGVLVPPIDVGTGRSPRHLTSSALLASSDRTLPPKSWGLVRPSGAATD
jgi:hypothetical protein